MENYKLTPEEMLEAAILSAQATSSVLRNAESAVNAAHKQLDFAKLAHKEAVERAQHALSAVVYKL